MRLPLFLSRCVKRTKGFLNKLVAPKQVFFTLAKAFGTIAITAGSIVGYNLRAKQGESMLMPQAAVAIGEVGFVSVAEGGAGTYAEVLANFTNSGVLSVYYGVISLLVPTLGTLVVSRLLGNMSAENRQRFLVNFRSNTSIFTNLKALFTCNGAARALPGIPFILFMATAVALTLVAGTKAYEGMTAAIEKEGYSCPSFWWSFLKVPFDQLDQDPDHGCPYDKFAMIFSLFGIFTFSVGSTLISGAVFLAILGTFVQSFGCDRKNVPVDKDSTMKMTGEVVDEIAKIAAAFIKEAELVQQLIDHFPPPKVNRKVNSDKENECDADIEVNYEPALGAVGSMVRSESLSSRSSLQSVHDGLTGEQLAAQSPTAQHRLQTPKGGGETKEATSIVVRNFPLDDAVNNALEKIEAVRNQYDMSFNLLVRATLQKGSVPLEDFQNTLAAINKSRKNARRSAIDPAHPDNVSDVGSLTSSTKGAGKEKGANTPLLAKEHASSGLCSWLPRLGF